MATEQFLNVTNLSVSYNTVGALFGISVEIRENTTLAVLGPNGAGKSTLARAICGLVPATEGNIVFNGTEIGGLAARRIHDLGITYVPEGRGIFPNLTVSENFRVAAWHRKSRSTRNAVIERSYELFPVLASRRNQMAGTMSGGEQQMLALGRAFCADSKLIVADELSLGLAPLIVDQVFAALDVARQDGTTIVVIEQFVNRALAMSDECIILSHGTVAWRGKSNEATQSVRNEYITQRVDS